MSGFSEDMILPASASEIEDCAAEWLQRRRYWKGWNEAAQSELDAWLEKSASHSVAYWRLVAGMERAERLAALKPRKLGRTADVLRRIRTILPRAVATLAVAAIMGTGAMFALTHSRGQTLQTGVGGHKLITLADGTRVELNTDTLMRVDIARGHRIVSLDHGEAYFQIVHDAAHPFIVRFGDHRITDLGTKFLLRGETNHLQLALIEGRARIESTASNIPPQSAILDPGDVAVATADALSISKKTTRELANELGWRNGIIVFRDTALADVAVEFNRYNTDRIIIADAAAGRRHVGGTFSTQDVRQFVIVVRDVLGLHVENRGREIVISR